MLVVVIAVLSDVTIGGVGDLILAALVFGLLNTFLKPLLKFITLPLAVITLQRSGSGDLDGDAAPDRRDRPSFNIHGFWALVWATLIVWLVNLALDLVPGPWRHTAVTELGPCIFGAERSPSRQCRITGSRFRRVRRKSGGTTSSARQARKTAA